MSTGIIILAAGNSSRLGQPKQLLAYQGKTLLEIVTDAARQSSANPIIVVLGSHAEDILKEVNLAGIHHIVNDSWEKGMSSSIALGLIEALKLQPALENVIITVSDQAFLNPEILEALITKQKTSGKNIVACSYGQTTGSPALFNKKYFGQLMALNGDKGAKTILEQYPEDTETITFELGHIDIDTEKDYYNLINRK